MSKNQKLIQKITIISLLAALSVVLRFFVVDFGAARIIFHNIPIMIAGMTFGPLIGIICALVADVSSFPYTPNWHPAFMLSASMWGLLPGLFKLFLDTFKLRNIIAIEIITYLFMTFVNTVLIGLIFVGSLSLEWIYLRLNTAIPIMLIKIPIDVMILFILMNTVMRKFFRPDKKVLTEGFHETY